MRRGDAPEKRGLGWVLLLAIVLSLLAWFPILQGYPKRQTEDGEFFHKMLEVARISVQRYHELPLWNPFECGGVALWDNPQGIGAAPLAWLTLLVGSTRTIEVWYIVHSVAGVLCMWAFARGELRLSPLASMVAAASWSFAGVHNQHFVGGHVVWVAYLYFPLAITLWRRAERDLWAAVGLGLIAALAMYEGGTYPLPYLAVLLGAETLLRVWPPRRLLRISGAAVVVVAVAFAVGAARFLPVLDQLTHHHRGIPDDTDAMHWETLRNIFVSRDHGRDAPGQQYVWPEFGDYVGPYLLTLALIGVLLVDASELWMVALAIFAFSLMCGHFSRWAPWSLLNKYVYPFKQMRVPSRFVAIVTLFLSVFAAMAVDRLPRRLARFRFARGETFRALVVALALIGVGDELSVGTSWSKQAFQGKPQDFSKAPAARLHFGGGGDADFLDTPHVNIADTGCWEEWTFEDGGALWQGDVPQARSQTKGLKILLTDRTTSTFTMDLEATKAGRILLNSNYDRGWRTDHGQTLRLNKMLAVDVPAGTYTLHLRYWPHGLTAGLCVSGVSIVLITGLFAWHVRRQRRAVRRAALASGRATVTT